MQSGRVAAIEIGLSLIVLGAVALIAAPLAHSCIEGPDYFACETTGNIVLNVMGGVLIVAGAVISLLGQRHKIAA